MKLTVAQIADIIPCNIGQASAWTSHLNNAMDHWNIDTPARQAGFLAQASFESRRLSSLEENLNYSVQGLANTWPSRFAVDPKAKVKVPNALAEQMGRSLKHPTDQQALANYVYGGRMGNVEPGDGWRYRGRGCKQVTGRANYQAYQDRTGNAVIKYPEILTRMDLAADSAGWFWTTHGCNELIDVGNYKQCTVVINGGLNGYEDGNTVGLDDRVELWENALRVLAA